MTIEQLTPPSKTSLSPLHSEPLKNYPMLNNEYEIDDFQVIRRNGKVTAFDANKIVIALTKAFLAVEGDSAANSSRIHERVEYLTDKVTHALTRRLLIGQHIHIEDIQDQVELALMREGEQKVARSYVLYREQQSQKRKIEVEETIKEEHRIHILMPDGTQQPLNTIEIKKLIHEACSGLAYVDAEKIMDETCHNLYDGVKAEDVAQVLVMTTRTLIEKESNYSQVTARLLLDVLRQDALSFLHIETVHQQAEMAKIYTMYFKKYIASAIQLELLDPRLGDYDLQRITQAILPERDLNFSYLGLQTLFDRYFIHTEEGIRFELPQAFFMRVAMGLAINESEREARAIEFYHLLSSFDFMSSTPTLFNSGTLRPQLSSCYLTYVPDDLEGIYNAIRDNALLSKFAGGLGNDWTSVRGLGAHIKGTNGKSQGVVPFLKVANDTAVAVNQGGKRKGAVCAYLESWHIDIEEFLELRKNTGDERRRTHDMNTANWIPDLFMKRVAEESTWTLFSPNETPDLHELYGQAFETAYLQYEKQAQQGQLKLSKEIQAVDLWRKMLVFLFETGHPWITFKDPCNIRYTNQHVGVVHSSNLCTEITLHTNNDEIAVCNLGSINLPAHIDKKGINHSKLQKTIQTAIRMLDNVIDYNFYSVSQAKESNLRHRPIGLGIMGFQDALFKMKIPYASQDAIDFADQSMEAVSYYAIRSSSDLAVERGRYETFDGSLWSQGILPIDSVKLLAQERGQYIQQDQSMTLDWDSLRQLILKQGMRNSNCMAIAPTATISNICGISQSIEPTYQNMYVKSNLSGEFTIVNAYLVHDLKDLGLWDDVMINDLKYYDGCLASIERIPEDIKTLYATAFEIDPRWLVEAASRRQKWIDQGQSLNLYMEEPSGKKLDNLYKLAWVRGLKTTYYLRSKGATGIEKTSINENKEQLQTTAPKACSILDPDCDACQ